jgi:hypothetical protein
MNEKRRDSASNFLRNKNKNMREKTVSCRNTGHKRTKLNIKGFRLKKFFAYANERCKTWSLVISDDHKLQMFEDTLLRIYLHLRRTNHVSNLGYYIPKNFAVHTAHVVLLLG